MNQYEDPIHWVPPEERLDYDEPDSIADPGHEEDLEEALAAIYASPGEVVDEEALQ